MTASRLSSFSCARLPTEDAHTKTMSTFETPKSCRLPREGREAQPNA
jgi:hypothetical protein